MAAPIVGRAVVKTSAVCPGSKGPAGAAAVVVSKSRQPAPASARAQMQIRRSQEHRRNELTRWTPIRVRISDRGCECS